MIPLDISELQQIWYVIVLVLLTGYAILDGFDLGVGILHLFSKSDHERRIMLNSIGPLWDGNEVWLVTAGGALFAGFPPVYATVCSSFYDFIMLFLFGLIFRAVAIEMRSKQEMAWWRWGFDILFTIASFILALGLGILLGNLITGIPLNAEGGFIGGYSDLLQPYALLTGCFTVSLFTMHGAIFILMKTEGTLHDKIRNWINPFILLFLTIYLLVTFITLIYQPHMTNALRERPYFFLIALLNLLSIAMIPYWIQRMRDDIAFFCSCCNIAFLITLFAIGTYPAMVRAINDPDMLSLTIFNSSSSAKTLSTLIFIALIGMPLVSSYTFAVYWVFHGKVKLDSSSY